MGGKKILHKEAISIQAKHSADLLTFHTLKLLQSSSFCNCSTGQLLVIIASFPSRPALVTSNLSLIFLELFYCQHFGYHHLISFMDPSCNCFWSTMEGSTMHSIFFTGRYPACQLPISTLISCVHHGVYTI